MAGEVTIVVNMVVRKGNLSRNHSAGYSADMAGTKGPSPGAVTVGIAGTDIDFSQITRPSLCWLTNLSTVSIVEYGIWDPEGAKFFPLGELLPGEQFPIRLSRRLQSEVGTGTGTFGGGATNRLRMYAMTQASDVIVEAYER